MGVLSFSGGVSGPGGPKASVHPKMNTPQVLAVVDLILCDSRSSTSSRYGLLVPDKGQRSAAYFSSTSNSSAIARPRWEGKVHIDKQQI